MSKHKVKRKRGVFGWCQVIDGWGGLRRLYVKKTNIKTWVVSYSETLSLDSMLEVAGEYHFHTLKDLNVALNQQTQPGG